MWGRLVGPLKPFLGPSRGRLTALLAVSGSSLGLPLGHLGAVIGRPGSFSGRPGSLQGLS
eukprot:1341755-Pyramimonas_sp.AAC.1